MSTAGFTGGYDVACKLLGLTAEQCSRYKEMHSAGKCVTMEVPNGVVLDMLTFTQSGKHLVQHTTKVNLLNPSSRTTEVCDLGGGIIVMRFHGCNNHALVRGWTQPLQRVVEEVKPQTTPVAQVPVQCTQTLHAQLDIWQKEANAVPGVRAAIAATRPDPSGHFAPNRVSRTYGGTFRDMHTKGQLQRSINSRAADIRILKANGRVVPMQSVVVTGFYKFPMPQDFVKGDIMQAVFQSLSGLSTPVSDLRMSWDEFFKKGCNPTTHFHAIEAE